MMLCTTVAVHNEMHAIPIWANGFNVRSRVHPNLSHISLLQGVDETHQVVTHWFKQGRREWTAA